MPINLPQPVPPDRTHPFRLEQEVYVNHRLPLFVTIHYHLRGNLDDRSGSILVATLAERAARWRLAVHAYCLMPTHMHIVCSLLNEQGDFLTFVKRFKAECSRRLRRAGFPAFRWQRSYWDRFSRSPEEVRTRILYTLANPVRKGLCTKWEDWPWSQYCGWPLPGEGRL
jgi:REP element-mobilizing transposase RayT